MSAEVREDWYTDFFTELPNEFWRRAVPPEATVAEVDFIETRLGLAPGLLSSYVFTRGEQETRATAIHHVYTVAHLLRLLADGGFTDVACFGGPDGAPFAVGDGRLLLTARRDIG